MSVVLCNIHELKMIKKRHGGIAEKGDFQVLSVLLFYTALWISLFHSNTQMLKDPKLDGGCHTVMLKPVLGLIHRAITGGTVA